MESAEIAAVLDQILSEPVDLIAKIDIKELEKFLQQYNFIVSPAFSIFNLNKELISFVPALSATPYNPEDTLSQTTISEFVHNSRIEEMQKSLQRIKCSIPSTQVLISVLETYI